MAAPHHLCAASLQRPQTRSGCHIDQTATMTFNTTLSSLAWEIVWEEGRLSGIVGEGFDVGWLSAYDTGRAGHEQQTRHSSIERLCLDALRS
jgi:hypothetical protein